MSDKCPRKNIWCNKAHNGDLTKLELSEEAPGGTFGLRSEDVDWSEPCCGEEHLSAEGL